jgi:hypothetical protein
MFYGLQIGFVGGSERGRAKQLPIIQVLAGAAIPDRERFAAPI